MNCTVDDCQKPKSKKGLCNAHYLRKHRHGTLDLRKIRKKISCSHFDDSSRKINWEHPLYNCYVGMYNRCYDKNNIKYKIYGARGIKVNDSWLGNCGFHRFVSDMGDRPIGSSLDRIDGSIGYSKDNCRWATIHEQNANKINNKENVGVTYSQDGRKSPWRVALVINGKTVASKSFQTEKEAIAYNRYARLREGIYDG